MRTARRTVAPLFTPSSFRPFIGRDTERETLLDAPVAQSHDAGERCFKCPKERGRGDHGWYFVDLEDQKRLLGPCRLYVCPQDYHGFAASERDRWAPVGEASDAPPCLNGSGNGRASAPEVGADAPCSADELIALLGHRGLVGWAFLVRDVAAGRVRRVHLRQLPADREIRQALIAYLHSAGTAVTLSRTFLDQQRRSNGS